MMMNYKMLVVFYMVFLLNIINYSFSYISFWIFLEILTLIMLLMIYNMSYFDDSNNLSSSMFMYFIIQSIMSIMMLILFMESYMMLSSFKKYFIMFLCVLFKLSLWPFHNWIFMLSVFLDYKIFNLMMFLSKIPLLYMMFMIFNDKLIYISFFFNMIFSMYILVLYWGLNINSLKFIIIILSMYNLIFYNMMFLINVNYFLFYLYMSYLSYNFFFTHSVFLYEGALVLLMFFLLTYSSPILFFFFKFYIILKMMNYLLILLLFLYLMMFVVIFFILSNMFFKYFNELKYYLYKYMNLKKKNSYVNFMMSMILFMFLLFF